MPVRCDVHPWMLAYVGVFDNPWFAVTDDAGAFAIKSVPEGSYKLVAWHERIGERRDKVMIRPGQTTDVTFTLPVLEPDK